MGKQAETYDDVMTPQIAEMGDDYFIDITVTCTELHDPWEVDYINSPQKISQCGIFEDAEGTQIRFKAWNGSDPPEFKEGETYDMTDMQMVYGKNAESYALVIRSKTKATVGSLPTAPGESVCPSCDTVLTDDNLHTGPDAPQIGWEYYECPECGEKMRPAAV